VSQGRRPRLFSHVDLRVRDRARAKAFYDALFAPLGMKAEIGANFTCYTIAPDVPDADLEWFGFTEDPAMTPGEGRLSLYAETRTLVDQMAAAARAQGARAIEGPALELQYGPTYYAVFFEDIDGNKLEVCCLAE
jgi:catechol 2,3-dioxygenase-like lactoylglutathione lyase family enzyme